jgi:hypothetical protein
MRLIQRTLQFSGLGPLALLVLSVGCGPNSPQESTWMLGTFSTHIVGLSGHTSAVGHYDFRADGTVIFGGVAQYGDSVIPEEEYTWERRGEEAIEVRFPKTYLGVEAWRIMPGDDCNLRREQLAGGEVVAKDFLYRGAVCLQKLAPCPGGGECPSTMTVWCDEAPPECDGK